MPQPLPDKPQLKLGQYLLTVNDVSMSDQTALYFPQSGQLSITYITTSVQSQILEISDGATVTPVAPGTHVYPVNFGAALLIAATGNGYVAFQLLWEYVS